MVGLCPTSRNFCKNKIQHLQFNDFCNSVTLQERRNILVIEVQAVKNFSQCGCAFLKFSYFSIGQIRRHFFFYTVTADDRRQAETYVVNAVSAVDKARHRADIV